jgi:hypothetical protein
MNLIKKLFIFFTVFLIVFSIIFYFSISLFKTYRLTKLYLRESEFQNQHKIDLLFLGSSHCHSHYNPFIFDKELNINSFNYGSPGQAPNITYFLAEKAIDKFEPKLIVLDIYFAALLHRKATYESKVYAFSFLFPLNERMSFIQSVRGKMNPLSFFLMVQEWFGNDLIKLISSKIFGYSIQDTTYIGKGFIERPNEMTEEELVNGDFYLKMSPSVDDIDNALLLDLKRTIEMIQRANIGVILVNAPLPSSELKSIQNYKKFHDLFEEIASEYNIKYLDLNLENSFDWKPSYYSDAHHLSRKGADMYSIYLSEMVVPKYFSE